MTKAVIVGINSYSQSPLQGCVNDAEDVIAYLTNVAGLAHGDIHPLFDGRATKEAIVSALRDMIAGSGPGDHLLFHYSGHGTQVESQDLDEPDGLDECLCPVNFDWDDPSTQLRDNEFAAILATVSPGTAMTAVLDSCNSGDMSKALLRVTPRARFLPWPVDIAYRLAKHKRKLRRTPQAARSNSLIISACRSDETSADTSFEGRANGAFTYNFLTTLRARADMALGDLMTKVTGNLVSFHMHPEFDGPATLQQATFLASPLPVPRRLPHVTGVAAAQILFEQAWNTKVFGMNFAVNLCIALGDAGFEFQLGCDAGLPLRWCFLIDGDTGQSADVGAGFRIAMAVTSWSASATSVSFDLALQVVAPFLAPIAIVQRHITLPRLLIKRSVAPPTSPADLLAMLQLAQLDLPKQAAGRASIVLPRSGDDQYSGQVGQETFVGGLFGCRYERHMDAYVPPGFLRHHVEVVLDPPSSGDVYFVAWDDADPHGGQFTYHVGCPALGCGTATFNLHCIRDPNILQQRPAPVPDSRAPAHGHDGHPHHNGRSKQGELADELARELRDAGGPVRT